MIQPGDYRYLAYGLHWKSDFPLDQFPVDPSERRMPEISVLAAPAPVPQRSEVCRWHNTRICEGGFRFQAQDGACFDYHQPGRLDVFPARAGLGAGAPFFYGTVTAAIAACRDALPVHGTAMASNGAAVLLCGPAGAGKSSTAAALAAKGFRLISDDLSVFRLSAQGELVISAGRTDIRLVPAAAQLLQKALGLSPGAEPTTGGKVLMRPPSVDPTEDVVLRSVISLQPDAWDKSEPGQRQGQDQDQDPGPKLKVLSENVFRPRLMRRLPGTPARAKLLLKMLGATQFQSLTAPRHFNDHTAEELAAQIAKFHRP